MGSDEIGGETAQLGFIFKHNVVRILLNVAAELERGVCDVVQPLLDLGSGGGVLVDACQAVLEERSVHIVPRGRIGGSQVNCDQRVIHILIQTERRGGFLDLLSQRLARIAHILLWGDRIHQVRLPAGD